MLKIIDLDNDKILEFGRDGIKTVGDLTTQIKESLSCQIKLYSGRKILHDPKDELWYHFLDDELFRIKRVGDGLITIFVKTLTGSTLGLDINPEDSILSIKKMIYEKTLIEPGRQRLIFAGHEILTCDKSAEYYDISEGATLHMVLQLRGGGGATILASLDKKNEVNLKFSNEDIPHRRVKDGFSIFGNCTNEDCDACGKEVIHQWGCNDFEFELHGSEATCPLCRETIIPKSFGFYQCEWNFGAIVLDKDFNKKLKTGTWKTVRDEFVYYGDESQSEKYIVLKIRTRPITKYTICNLCNCPIKDDDQINRCNKIYHVKCMQKWIKGNSKCPNCEIRSRDNCEDVIESIKTFSIEN